MIWIFLSFLHFNYCQVIDHLARRYVCLLLSSKWLAFQLFKIPAHTTRIILIVLFRTSLVMKREAHVRIWYEKNTYINIKQSYK